MIPNYQKLMRPVLEHSKNGEVRIADVVDRIADDLKLSDEERTAMLPSGGTRISNRVHWARTYLVQAGLLEATRRGHIRITARGLEALNNPNIEIDNAFLEQFEEYQDFKNRSRGSQPKDSDDVGSSSADIEESTPDEILKAAHQKINAALGSELLNRVQTGTPDFFERMLVSLFLAMGYGGSVEEAGRALGRTGDNGVDGVIDQDPLGVDQIYVQAKRYADGNSIGPGDIRDFFGALNLKRAQKGIFVTTSSFTSSAIETAQQLGTRIVLIDGNELTDLMITYNIGCRDQEVLHLKKIDEDYFE